MSDRTDSTRRTVLVGISNPDTVERLVHLAGGIAESIGGDVILTHVVPVASQISLTTGQSSPEVIRARDFVHNVCEAARSSGVTARGLVEVARSVEDGLLAAAESHAANTILVGYSDHESDDDRQSGEEERFDRTMHRVARKAHADVVVAKLRRESHEAVAVPVATEIPLGLTKVLCEALADAAGAKPTFFHVVEPGASPEEARRRVSDRLEEAGLLRLGRLKVLTSESLVDTVVDAVADYDLVILTPADRPGLLDRVYSSRAEKMAERVSASAILAWGSEADS